jgi:colanic acid/amylovoran biosynthesis glycosyltransferase
MDEGKKLKVLVVVRTFPVITHSFIFNQITGLIDLGHDVSIFAMHVDEQKTEHSEIEKYKLRNRLYTLDNWGFNKWEKLGYVVKGGISLLIRKPMVVFRMMKQHIVGRCPLSLRSFCQINSVADLPEKDFDIIHAQLGPLGNDMMMLIELGVLKGKLITQFRGYDASQLIRSRGDHYYDLLFAHGDMFLPVCDYIKDKIITLGAPKDKTFVLYSGVITEKFVYKKRDFGKSGSLLIGSVGRLTAKKGYEYVIKALSILKAEGFDFTYEIVGDGELRDDIMSLINHYGLDRNIILLGSKNHDYIVGFLHKIDIFISHNVTADSGDQEGIPNSLKEAMLSGVPVFSTFHGGIPELINDENNGFLTEEKNIQQLVSKLKEFAFPLQDLGGITRNAREVVESMFDNTKLSRELVSRYYSLIH